MRGMSLSLIRATAGLTIGLALAGCMVGPDYEGPPDAAPAAMRAGSFHRARAETVVATPPLSQWWLALEDPILDRIETLALASSPTLGAAEARVRNARATVGERTAGLLPSGGAEALYLRARPPGQPLGALSGSSSAGGGQAASGSAGASGGSSSGRAVDVFAPVLDATWQLDLFGGTRRKIESARARAQYQQAELEDAQVTLTGDVARAYVDLRDRQRRLALYREDAAVQRRAIGLMQQRRAGGTATDMDVDRLVTQLKQTEAEVPTLEAEVEVYTDQLSQLSGQEPGALDRELSPPRPLPLPPARTEVGNPATMIRHRPDIRAAERTIAAENASIGANIAQYFPQVTLLGTIGYASTQTKTLFAGNALTYLGGPSIAWNIFNAPQISAQVAESRASTEEAQGNYRKTVLAALLDAENSLSRFGHQRDDVAILAEASTAASHSAALASQRFAGGTMSVIDMLEVVRQRIQTQNSLAQGEARLTSDWISLQGSLGLGWQGSTAPEGPVRTAAAHER